MFTRLVVVNRGEPAVRVTRAVRALDEERGTHTTVIALHTEAESGALYVRGADEVVCLRTPEGGGSPYLDHVELERALVEARADAVWVGWGFVAEDPDFAELCDRLGVVFVGPPAEAMRRLGDKIEAKLLAESMGVPVAPWSGGPVTPEDDAHAVAVRVGYPLMVKARSGGGGRGIRAVHSADELDAALQRTRSEAAATFGDPVVFLEAMITGGRHVEVQVIADAHGTVWAPGVRDCSVQRRHQKLVEESGSPVLTTAQTDELRRVSAALVVAAGYRGAGTVEYLYQPEDGTFAFMEVNTRLQVEHPVTEATTGLDLVALQLLVAAGEPLPGECPPEVGHAIEARLNAEDAEAGFAPAPGTVTAVTWPAGPGIRVDTHVTAGEVVLPEYDSMVAKVIAWGRDRPQALARLRCALRETTVLIAGGTTTRSFLLDVLGRPEVVSGEADTQWLDRLVEAGATDAGALTAGADVALIAVAVGVHAGQEAVERAEFLASARGGRPRAGRVIGRTVELGYRGRAYTLEVAQVGPHRYRVVVDGLVIGVDVDRHGPGTSVVTIGGRRYDVRAGTGTGSRVVEVDGTSHRVVQDEVGLVRSPAPAVVVAVRVAPGEEVSVGQTVVVLESMKMETAVRATTGGVVREVLAAVNSQVDAGAPLLRIDQVTEDAGGPAGAGVDFSGLVYTVGVADARGPARELVADLRALLTGYDVSTARGRELVRAYLGARGELDPGDPGLLSEELSLLTTFADVCDLSRNQPADDEGSAQESVHSPREHLHTYLRSLDAERENLPESFRRRLSRAVNHHGVAGLTPSPGLAEAVYRVFLAQQRVGDHIAVVTTLLEHWLGHAELIARVAPQEVAEVLERLLRATQLRYPAVGDLTRSLRYRAFEEPLARAAREEAHAVVQAHLSHLDRHPDAADRVQRIEAMVARSEPVAGLLGQRLLADAEGPEPLVEVITRRLYKVRSLQGIRSFLDQGRQVVTGSYELVGTRLDLVCIATDRAGLTGALHAAAGYAGGHRDLADLVLDLYVAWSDTPVDAEELAGSLHDLLSGVTALGAARRVTVTVFAGADVRVLTYRPSGVGPVEDRVIRDMHPLTGQRLDLWRLKNFNGTRLPSPEQTFLFRCVAKDNPADERLVAMAEIRDVTPLRAADGRVAGFPAVERALSACLDGIRRHEVQRRGAGPDANRIFLYVWPTIEITFDELRDYARATAPLTARAGAGLEEILLLGRLRVDPGEAPRDVAVRFAHRPGTGVTVSVSDPPTEPVPVLDAYAQKVRSARARGATYPYELIATLTGPQGTFTEYDYDGADRLVPVDRAPGGNTAGIVVGVVSTPTGRYPEGMTRVVLLGDPTRSLGSVAEPECARVVAALDLAAELGVPVEWFAISSGAKISMDSGTENMDWVARGLRRIISFTQAGGEVNVVVAGINVGAQPYWNAEATMLMHTKGILVMTPDGAMVLTGKQSLDYSGGVSAEDNFGIGGYDRVMGPNGQAQYWAPDLAAACRTLFAHYEFTYVAPGEPGPRRAITTDPVDRDVRTHPHHHPASEFTCVGDIFSATTNPERKKAFDIRTVMRAVVDVDRDVLERWVAMADADTTVVLDAFLGGYPVTVLGIESRPMPRRGTAPADGPDVWTAGTLFPRSSKKAARAINSASGNRPLVVLANLSGFDGSPESLRGLQLEYGAEIGRAIVNFDGPIVFCVVSRYHGGAFVVFSGVLNDNMEIIAVEGSYASVIGGAPAAAVVFAREVSSRTSSDPRVGALHTELDRAGEAARPALRVELATLRTDVRSEKLGEVAEEFERVHDIERARTVGSVHTIIAARDLRPYLIGAVERGIGRARTGSTGQGRTDPSTAPAANSTT